MLLCVTAYTPKINEIISCYTQLTGYQSLSPVSKRAREAAPLSVPWVLTEGATTARDFAWRDDTLIAGFSARGRGVRGLAVEESESCTVTQLMTFVRWLKLTLCKQGNSVTL